jgi:penicillin amidase
MLRVLKYIGLGVAGLVGMVALYLAGTAVALRGSLPQLSGTITVAGPAAPVRIVRDAEGIPHIYAQSRDDALFGLGFVHAQDRLWQMEFQRRTVQGRLSEIAGDSTFTTDVYLRTLGLYRAAEQAATRLSPDARAALDAYTAGVNAARPKDGRMPPEFFMLGVDPEPWRPADSVAVLKGLAAQLSANAFQEVFRLQLLKTLGPDKARAFNPPLPANVIEAYRAYAPKETTKFAEALDAVAPAMEPSGASNNWVVGGGLTASGKPLLANDPHLPLTVPAIWYLAHLSWPGGDAIGGSIPGVPAIVAGRTAHLAWGMTTTGADTQDLYWERIDPDNPNAYLTPDGSAAFATRAETIKVRLGEARTLRIRSTRHGPVLPTDEGPMKALTPEGYALAIAWPAIEPDDRTMETALAIFSLNGATAADVERVFSTYRSPIQSFVLASDKGDIGLILPGTIPIRRADNPVLGLLPGDGRDPRFDWTGAISYAEGPHWEGGANDMFITANNNVVPPGYPRMIALDFDPEHRAQRIKELLSARDKPFTVERMREIQLDDRERFAVDVLPGMLALAKPTEARATKAHAMLKAWDLRMRPDRPEPLMFAAWMRAFTKALAADELGELFPRVWNDRPSFITAVIAGEAAAASFCDDAATKTAETCADVLTASLASAMSELTDTYGEDLAAWRWGEAHRATFSHTAFGFLPVLRDIFALRAPMGGGISTIQRAAYRYGSSEPFAAVHGSGYRAVYDLGSPNESIFMIATGQSGNIYSPHYGDLTPRWARGEYLRMTTDKPEIERNAAATLVLQPPSESAR